jgi:hypothetical protein
MKPSRAEIDQNGKIVLDFGSAGAASEGATPLDDWKAKRHARAP